MRALIILVGVVFASAAFLIQPVQAQVVSDVEGQVCAASPWEEDYCERGLAGASLQLIGGPAGLEAVDQTATADEEGAFSFADVPDGDYELRVDHSGFKAVALDITTPSEPITVFLEPQDVVVQGTVTDADGEPVPEARVTFWGYQYVSAYTDGQGEYMTELTAGQYTMEVEAYDRGYIEKQVFVDGSRIDVELGSLPGQTSTVEGVVKDLDGAPVAGVDVRIDQWEAVHADGKREYGNFRNWTQTDDQGRYEANVYGGGISLSFSKEGYSQEYEWIELDAGETRTLDAEMTKYPDKTARLQGKVTSQDGAPLADVRISIEHPEYGLYTCSDSGHYGHAVSEPAMAYGDESGPYYEPYDPGCDISIHEDGTFTGNVTPGYGIISVWYDHWASCSDTHHSDGSYERDCGADYFGYVETRHFEAEADNPITIELRQKPTPDATISGYLVDGEKDEAIANARISFSHQETYGWGSAQADGDGSYKIRVHSGYHHVSVWAEGYLPWEGAVYIASGDTAFDVVMTPGEARYGGCCYGVVYAESMDASGGAPASHGSPEGGYDDGYDGGYETSGGSQSGDEFEDLGGGLGPYDPAQRAQEIRSESKNTPMPFALVVVGLAVLAARRR